MAALTAVFISAADLDKPWPDGPVRKEKWRIPAGSIADTATITPRFGGRVISGDASLCDHDLTTADASIGADTSITFTLRVAITGAVDATIFVKN